MESILPPVLRAAARVIVIMTLAVAFTALCVSTSQKKGRLSSSPNYDDIVYMNDGAALVHETRSQGWDGVSIFVEERGLHSPYSIGLAAASFVVLGPDKTSPYYANSLVVLFYLGAISWLGRRLHPVIWLATLLLALSLPFATMGVAEFRPDIAWAVTTGFGAVFIVTRDELFRRPGQAAVAGLFLALSLLIKPSTFVMTSLLYVGAITSRILPVLRRGELASRIRQTLVGALAFTVTALVVAGPYWGKFGGNTWRYFFLNSFGANKSIWAYTGDFHDSLLFYISGEGYLCNVGRPGMILSGLILGAIVYLLIKRPALRWQILSLVGLAAGALLVNTVAQMKSPFLGGGIYGVWIFGGIYLINQACHTLDQENPRKGTACAAGLFSVAALMAIFCYKWPPYSDWTGNPVRVANFSRATEFIENLLSQHKNDAPKRVLVMQAGPVVPEVVGLWFPFHGLKASVANGSFIPDGAAFSRNYPQYDWVVIQETGMMGNTPNMPSEAQLPRFLEILRADTAYRPIASYEDPDHRKLWVYARPIAH